MTSSDCPLSLPLEIDMRQVLDVDGDDPQLSESLENVRRMVLSGIVEGLILDTVADHEEVPEDKEQTEQGS